MNDDEIILVNATVWKNFLWRRHSHTCIPIQQSLPDKVDLLQLQILFSALYFLVWIVAVSGNALVLYIVTIKQVSLSVRTIFIGSLAISDILMSLTSLPVTAVTIFTRDWVFPSIFCRLIGVFQGGSIFVSSFTLTVIAVDRLLLIIYPSKEIITFERALAIVISIWAIGYSFSLPNGIFSRTVRYYPYCGTFCEEAWPDSNVEDGSKLGRIYGTAVMVLQFGVPVLISSFCYWRISRVISQQIEKRREQQILLKESEQKLTSRRTRSNRMMVCMVLGLVLAWLPLNLINLSRDFNGVSAWFSTIFALCHVIAMTSAAWNPVIYSWFNPQLRRALITMFNDASSSNKERLPLVNVLQVTK